MQNGSQSCTKDPISDTFAKAMFKAVLFVLQLHMGDICQEADDIVTRLHILEICLPPGPAGGSQVRFGFHGNPPCLLMTPLYTLACTLQHEDDSAACICLCSSLLQLSLHICPYSPVAAY